MFDKKKDGIDGFYKNNKIRYEKSKPIIIKGSNGRFNGVYDVDQLIIKLLIFVFITGVIALIFL